MSSSKQDKGNPISERAVSDRPKMRTCNRVDDMDASRSQGHLHKVELRDGDSTTDVITLALKLSYTSVGIQRKMCRDHSCLWMKHSDNEFSDGGGNCAKR